MTNFSDHDAISLNYKHDADARKDLTDGLVDAAKHLKSANPTGYKNLVQITAKAFNVTNKTAREWLMGHREFIGKGNPRKVGGISGEKVYKMKVAYAKALILGQGDIQVTRDTKTKQITGSDAKAMGKSLRAYLENDFTRTQGMRLKINDKGVLTWEYARYSDDSDSSSGSYNDVNDWTATLDKWNPGFPTMDTDVDFFWGAS